MISNPQTNSTKLLETQPRLKGNRFKSKEMQGGVYFNPTRTMPVYSLLLPLLLLLLFVVATRAATATSVEASEPQESALLSVARLNEQPQSDAAEAPKVSREDRVALTSRKITRILNEFFEVSGAKVHKIHCVYFNPNFPKF